MGDGHVMEANELRTTFYAQIKKFHVFRSKPINFYGGFCNHLIASS
jgi:hypothetical protein